MTKNRIRDACLWLSELLRQMAELPIMAGPMSGLDAAPSKIEPDEASPVTVPSDADIAAVVGQHNAGWRSQTPRTRQARVSRSAVVRAARVPRTRKPTTAEQQPRAERLYWQARPRGLDRCEWATLEALDRHGLPMTRAEIARAIGSSAKSVNRAVLNLCDHVIVEHDGRARRRYRVVRPMPAGLDCTPEHD
jgi:hypothetical protein